MLRFVFETNQSQEKLPAMLLRLLSWCVASAEQVDSTICDVSGKKKGKKHAQKNQNRNEPAASELLLFSWSVKGLFTAPHRWCNHRLPLQRWQIATLTKWWFLIIKTKLCVHNNLALNHMIDKAHVCLHRAAFVQHKLTPTARSASLSFLWVSFSVLHTLHIGQRVLLSSAPPWPVKWTSAVSVMRAIHLERGRTSERWRTSGPMRPSTCHTQASLIYPAYRWRSLSPAFAVECSSEALSEMVFTFCLSQIRDTRWRTSKEPCWNSWRPPKTPASPWRSRRTRIFASPIMVILCGLNRRVRGLIKWKGVLSYSWGDLSKVLRVLNRKSQDCRPNTL